MRKSTRTSRILSVSFAIIAALSSNAFSAVFTNSTPITIPAPGSSAGTQISVSGLANQISFAGLVVTVTGFTALHENDVDLVLVGPTGAALVLMGDCGTSATASNLSLNFSDGAVALPLASPFTSSGTFAATQYASVGSFPSPGPGLAYKSPPASGTSNLFNVFGGTNPNGTWSLYAMDSVSGDTGQISSGWSLQITATPEPASLSLLLIAASPLFLCRRNQTP